MGSSFLPVKYFYTHGINEASNEFDFRNTDWILQMHSVYMTWSDLANHLGFLWIETIPFGLTLKRIDCSQREIQ